jgi:hypothetical protein
MAESPQKMPSIPASGRVKKLQVIKHSGFWSVEILKLDPFWDPVRNHGKFREIISNPEYQVNLSDD